MPVSGAELKTTLGALGLPPSWFAVRMDVTMRTVVRWFDLAAVTTEVANELEEIQAQTLKEMRKMVKSAGKKDPVVLQTFRTDEESLYEFWPASWHRALTYRVLEHFRAEGRTVRVEYLG